MRFIFTSFFCLALILYGTNAQLNSCNQSPCKNDGFCLEKPNSLLGYSCECKKGFNGYNCNLRKKRNDEQNDGTATENDDFEQDQAAQTEEASDDDNTGSTDTTPANQDKKFGNINIMGQNINIIDMIPKESVDNVVQTIRNKTDLKIIGQNINLVDTIVGNSSVEDVAQTITDKAKDLPLPIIIAIVISLLLIGAVLGGFYYMFYVRNK